MVTLFTMLRSGKQKVTFPGQYSLPVVQTPCIFQVLYERHSSNAFSAPESDGAARRTGTFTGGDAIGEYGYAPHYDVSVNDGPHIRRWSHKIIVL